MKKSIQILFVLLMATAMLKAQQVSPGNEVPVVKDHAYYMKKAASNRAASWCLLGGGFVIAGIGALSFPKDYDYIFENSTEKEDKASGATTTIAVGCAIMLASIPFTIMAGANKRKAKLMVSSQPTGKLLPPGVGNSVTGMTLKISLGR